MISSKAFVELKNVCTNNLKGFSVKIPLKALTVIVGQSGSGKSSLAFDTLAKIGLQRLKHLLNYSSPVLAEEGIKAEVLGALPPVIALAQGVRDWYPYKLVGELLGLYPFLNNRFMREGEYFCSACKRYTRNTPFTEVISFFEALPEGTKFYFLVPLRMTSKEGLRYLYEQGFTRFLVEEREWDVSEMGFPQEGKKVYLLLDRMVKKSEALGRLFENIRLSREINGGLFIIKFLDGEERIFNLQANCAFCGSPLITFFKKCEACGGIGYKEGKECPICSGLKLTPQVLESKLFGRKIRKILTLPLEGSLEIFQKSLLERVQRFKVEYLSLSTPVFKLSLGERKLLELLLLFSLDLTDLLIVLDEPTLGLDLERRLILLSYLRELVEMGNTLVVVEHDPIFIRSADYIIELGFKGKEGGYLLYQGETSEFISKATTLTAKLLRGEEKIEIPYTEEGERKILNIDGEELSLFLQNINLFIPGFSKQNEKIFIKLIETLREEGFKIMFVDEVSSKVKDEVLISYLKLWDSLREVLLLLPESRAKGLTKRHFSFHTKDGVCPNCQGKGYVFQEFEGRREKTICEECLGKRLNREVLNLLYKGYKLQDILDFTIKEFKEAFTRLPKVQEISLFAEKAGIAYLRVSQSLKELSGGERVRVNLVRMLVEGGKGDFLVLFYPFQGLHLKDVERYYDFLHYLATNKHLTIIIYDSSPVAQIFCQKVINPDPQRGFTKEEMLNLYNLYFKN